MENNLLIGVIDSEQPIGDQLSDSFRTNKIGGYPVLSSECNRHMICRFNAQLVCDLCEKPLVFVLQICCPIDYSPIDRLIYIFVCINTKCNQNKWFALRCITTCVDVNDRKDMKTIENNDWTEGQNDWDNEDNGEDFKYKTNSCAHSMASLSVNDRCESIRTECKAFFRPFYVSVFEESERNAVNDKHINQLMETYERNNEKQINDKSTNSLAEDYEQNCLNTIYRNDRQNYQFFKRLSLCPKQIIRYQWKGMPLLNRTLPNPKPLVPQCESCGAQRSFEFQLMPALITYLKPLSDIDIDIDFGTVLIYTCSQNCFKSDSLSAEYCVVLSDPDNEFVDELKK